MVKFVNNENSIKGLVAQSVECTLCKRKVEGSKPFWSKNPYKEVSIFLYGNVIQQLVYFVVAEKTRVQFPAFPVGLYSSVVER